MAERILVVDDEKASRDVLKSILALDGFEVDLAANGSEALVNAKAHLPDLILLDLLMPDMSGFEICRLLKQDPATRDIPIIVVTGMDRATAKEAVLTSGADDYVTKPMRIDDLRARVGAMLKVRRIREELDRTLAYLHEMDTVRSALSRAALARAVAGPAPNGFQVASPIPVLLVDDEAVSLKVYEDMLTEHGFQVFAATTGSEGLALAGQHPIETAILDIVMPAMSGLEVLEQLHRAHPDLPVIMLTGHATSKNAIAALKLGAFDFLVKGPDNGLIVSAV
ncbi:MAG TPA: response regulator, partial [Candidatus Acidoferrum sp.]|nr:response regulator [Candidatus Acidoferrum sp.]